MKLIIKRIKVIQMTKEEHSKFLALMAQAAEGHTSHYAESKLSDGSFLGVALVDEHELSEREQMEQARCERAQASNKAKY